MDAVLHASAFQDNYIWLPRGKSDSACAVVDPGDAKPVRRRCRELGFRPSAILCTHHHYDHSDGIEELVEEFGIPVYGPAGENIPRRTHALAEGDRFSLPELGLDFEVFDVPGHTAGHIAFLCQAGLFSGDTLFSAGCGRLFEGTAEQLHTSLGKLAALPADTAIFCGHEYTLANLAFAMAVEPDNPDIRQRLEQVRELRAAGKPSLPVSIAVERRCNPFLRCDQHSVRASAEAHAGQSLANATAVFAEIRRWKDGFQG
jgi:hydroxyacylglutathione hydrolase